MSDGGPINVTVSTEAVAREVSRLGRDIGDLKSQLHGDLASLNNNMLQSQQEIMEQMVLQLAQMERVREEVRRGIEAEAQTKIFEQFSAISSETVALESATRRLSERYHKATYDMEQVHKRYDELDQQVRQSYKTDIRRLGKHIFEIWETHFVKTIESRIVRQHVNFLDTVLSSIEKIRTDREGRLSGLLESLSDKLNVFLEKRRQFETSIESIKVDNLPLTGEVAIPMIIVKSQGEKQSMVIAGHEVVQSTDQEFAYKLRKMDMLQTLRSGFKDADQYLEWRLMNSSEIDAMLVNLQKAEDLGYFSAEYGAYLREALRNRVPMIPIQVKERNIGQTEVAVKRG